MVSQLHIHVYILFSHITCSITIDWTEFPVLRTFSLLLYISVDNDYYIAQSQWIQDSLFNQLRPNASDSIKQVYKKREDFL